MSYLVDVNGHQMADYQKDMTLDEIAANDLEMTKDAIKNANRYRFGNMVHAANFSAQCLKSTLEYLGIKNPMDMTGKALDRMQKKQRIKIERRNNYKGKDKWRCGWYVYKKDVLVAFISEVLKTKRHPLLINPINQEWHVITNARVA